MRRPGEIHQKFKQVLYRHRKRAIEAVLKPTPENCAHNGIAPTHPGWVASGGARGPLVQLRVCKNVEAGIAGVICDSHYAEGLSGVCARTCPHYRPVKTPEDVKEEFRQLASQSLGDLAAKYPDLAALAWVLKDPVEVTEEADDVQDVPPSQERFDEHVKPTELVKPPEPVVEARWRYYWRGFVLALQRFQPPWR